MNQICDICATALSFRWTDTHGIGVCCTCGAPYTILHYDPETKARIDDRGPELALTAQGKTLAQRYWHERRRMVFPASYDMGFTSRSDRTYSGATREDERLFHEWLGMQPESHNTGSDA